MGVTHTGRVVGLCCLAIALNAAAHAADPTLRGRVVGIVDGDTIQVLVGASTLQVRLAQIDTPELGQPYSQVAKRRLSELVYERDVVVDVIDTDRHLRIVGSLYRDGEDICRTLVASGLAWAYRRYLVDDSLLDVEARARSARVGLWADDSPVPPWDWRKGERSIEPAVTTRTTCGRKRHCREMASCAEARTYLTSCGLRHLDGDRDGVPCERLCP
jgi:endonuclease YncB( thermonuclease family)